MSFRFEKLNVWQDARVFVNHIYAITRKFPRDEKFGLIDQLRRAALSVILNIDEGADRKSDAELKRFLRMAITSVEEVVTGLYIAHYRRKILIATFHIVITFHFINFLVKVALIKSLS